MSLQNKSFYPFGKKSVSKKKTFRLSNQQTHKHTHTHNLTYKMDELAVFPLFILLLQNERQDNTKQTKQKMLNPKKASKKN